MGSETETPLSEARDEVPFQSTVDQYGWIVTSLAAKLAKGDEAVVDDLKQVGLITLDSVRRDYPPGGRSFTTYAYARIRDRMRNYLRDEASGGVSFRVGSSSLSARKNEVVALEHASMHDVVGHDEAGLPLHLGDCISDPTANVEEQMLLDERDRQIRAAVSLLPERDRAILQMYFFDGMTTLQMAKALNLSDFTVREQIQHALRRLKPKLQDV